MRKSLFVLALTGGFILACSGGEEVVEEEEEEVEKVEEPVEEAPPARRGGKAGARAGTGSPTNFQCCGLESVENMMQEYLDLHDALYTKNDPAYMPSSECYALHGAANAVKKDPKVRPGDQKTATELAALMDKVKTGKTAEIREDLDMVTGYVSELARAYPGGKFTVAEAECVGQGSWIQEGAVMKSPYGAAPPAAGRGGKGKGKRGGAAGAVPGCHWK